MCVDFWAVGFVGFVNGALVFFWWVRVLLTVREVVAKGTGFDVFVEIVRMNAYIRVFQR